MDFCLIQSGAARYCELDIFHNRNVFNVLYCYNIPAMKESSVHRGNVSLDCGGLIHRFYMRDSHRLLRGKISV